MPKRGVRAKARLVAWWLGEGEEECPHCGRLYAYEAEFRCPDCDRPSCPYCKKRHAERDVCTECVEDCEEAERGSAHG